MRAECTRECLKCEASKIQMHTRSKLGVIKEIRRFKLLHSDIVGLLPAVMVKISINYDWHTLWLQ